ncbi:MAG: hypothetical protein WB647_14515 [Roseiarcus sp.]|uniref:hypothetical protein n=1 Tax=Roseiarcus sp. TaxID=1969460 RepID=UPI003C44240F
MSGSQTTLMLSSACCRLTKFAAYARAHGARRSREFAVNFILLSHFQLHQPKSRRGGGADDRFAAEATRFQG